MKIELRNPIKLFKPTGNIDWQQEFAQIPFGYVVDDKLKVVFATRRKQEQNGNYRSYPAQAIFSLDDFSLLSIYEKPLLELGGPGTFDEFGVMPGTILELQSGEEVMYYCGWSRTVSTPYRWSIGIAFKSGLENFERKYLGPVMGQTVSHPYLTASPVVISTAKSGYEMFHLTGVSWDLIENKLEPRYVIARSISTDGVHWVPSDLSLGSVRWKDECQTSPNIFFMGKERFMTFSYRSQSNFRDELNRNYRTAVAKEVSPNCWVVVQSSIELHHDDSIRDDIAYLHSFKHNGKFFALYNYSSGFGTSGIYLAQMEISI